MGTDITAGQDCDIFRFDGPDFYARVQGFERCADARDGAAGAATVTQRLALSCSEVDVQFNMNKSQKERISYNVEAFIGIIFNGGIGIDLM